MTSLVLLDYDANGIKQPSRSAVAAAAKLGEVHALVAGSGIAAAGEAAAKLSGVAKVLVADAPGFDHALAEPLAALLVSLAPNYTHLLAAATAVGKNVMPGSRRCWTRSQIGIARPGADQPDVAGDDEIRHAQTPSRAARRLPAGMSRSWSRHATPRRPPQPSPAAAS